MTKTIWASACALALTGLAPALIPSVALAKATPAEAATLCNTPGTGGGADYLSKVADLCKGKTLTFVGAEIKANASGQIEAWSPIKYYKPDILTLTPASIQATAPAAFNAKFTEFTQAKPLFVIDKSNMAKYAANLTEGHKKLLTSYADYKMPVYKTQRTGFFPAAIDDATIKNATTAELQGTEVVKDATLGFPFPIPKSGTEAIWNHKMKYLGDAARRYNNQAIVQPDGSYQLTKLTEDVKFKYANIKEPGSSNNNLLVYYLSETLSPPKDEGQLLLVHEQMPQRKAWLYNPGQRRVRLAPNVGYDNPAIGTDNQQTNDQVNVFNGAMDRYTWKLVGKKEFFIPYNSVKINDRTKKYTDIIKKGHVNQDLARYELHRVWVVEADLKPGSNHQFKKRRFYLDEDSWSIAAVDLYDNRDQLYKFQEAHLLTAPWVPTVTGSPELIYDFQSGRYFATALSNEDKISDTSISFPDSYFLDSQLAKRAKK